MRPYATESESGVVNAFFHHFDVLDVDAMPVNAPDIPQKSYLMARPVPRVPHFHFHFRSNLDGWLSDDTDTTG